MYTMTTKKGPSKATFALALPIAGVTGVLGGVIGGAAGFLGGVLVSDFFDLIGFTIFGGLGGLGQSVSSVGNILAGILSGLGYSITGMITTG